MKSKATLKETLQREDTRDERAMLFIVILVLGFCNAAVMVLTPAYVLYRRMLDFYPFVSRFELHSWLAPIVFLSLFTGMVVYYVTLVIYVRLHNAIDGRLPDYREVDY